MRTIVLLCAMATFITAPVSDTTSHPDALTVHEWGTFTSIAGADGRAVQWLPQAGPSDLPCFVERNRFNVKGSLSGTVRMETPVLYFYATRETTVNVRVRFQQGAITEWFPHAMVTPGGGPISSASESTITWRDVKVTPEVVEEFPIEEVVSPNFAPRRTDATHLRAGRDRQWFLV